MIARILDGKHYISSSPKKVKLKQYLKLIRKEYSAEYQSQALIDLAKKLKKKNYKI
ncbi:MAG: hypothetical protein CM15mP58_17380 [Burkholderiaceae bacterium]|nr:MAG: hypothetical protein CM15mP58_17380 [Burkholderiaceae bacterium]